uniref:endo-1,4-beta-xylanase n=1 Tax=Paenibacillus sp. FSL E2-0178 TaxID=2921361 RepID=UPI00406CEF08
MGLKILITELDISMFRHEDKRTDLKAPTLEMLRLPEERYAEIFALLLEYKASIDSVTFWGVADDYIWLDGFAILIVITILSLTTMEGIK